MSIMGLNERIHNARYSPAKKEADASPKQGVRRFGYVLFHNFWRLMALGALFLLFCLPVLTIPASLCGLNRVLIQLTRRGQSFLWSDFIKEFKACLFKSLPFGLLSAFLLFDSYVAAAAAASADGTTSTMPLLAVAGLLFALYSLFTGYAFVFLPSLNLGGRGIAGNVLSMMRSEGTADLIIIALNLFSVLGAIALFPFSLLLLPIWFVWMQLAICVCVNGPMQRRIVAPYEESLGGHLAEEVSHAN